MATEVEVTVARIQNMREHPNAAFLSLADVLGYQVIIPLIEDPDGKIKKSVPATKEDAKPDSIVIFTNKTFSYAYNDGDLIVFFPPDTIIPCKWVEKFGVRNYMKGADNNRVGRISLRKEPSFGLVVDIPVDMKDVWNEGDNVSEYFECTKYEPPVAGEYSGAAKREPHIDDRLEKFIDIQNGRIHTRIFEEGEEIVVTEKIHGTSCIIGVIESQRIASSRKIRRAYLTDEIGNPLNTRDPRMARNPYWFPWTMPCIENMLVGLGVNGNVLLYGEVFGGSVQSLTYGIPKGQGYGFRAFGLKAFTDMGEIGVEGIDPKGEFLNWDAFASLCKNWDVPTVPVIYRGPYSLEKMKELAEGKSLLKDDQIREGIVVYPVKERLHPKIGRVVLKYVSLTYDLSKHKEKDTTDV